jgi:hypothetical protein
MTTIEVDAGDKVRITATFTDPDTDAAVTPTAVIFAYQLPGAAAAEKTYGTDPEVTLVSEGVYRLVLDCDSPGRIKVRVRSTGTGKAAEAAEILVTPSPL